ncbi:MAG: 50S ribosome-binding GTPase, partial [Eubacterium sp.]|nr:50S ribosome-binding GTPase [Eubacterium sp.]
EKRSAFVTIVGIPNVGKSSLLNRILGHTIPIFSSPPTNFPSKIFTAMIFLLFYYLCLLLIICDMPHLLLFGLQVEEVV